MSLLARSSPQIILLHFLTLALLFISTSAEQDDDALPPPAPQRAERPYAADILFPGITKVQPKLKCLKQGTKILMADWTEKEVQDVRAGELVLDVELNPTEVVGVAHRFLQDQSFYGFSPEEDQQFFTNAHIWVGPGGSAEGRHHLYTQSVDNLLRGNPLMSYLNVSQFQDGAPTSIFHVRMKSMGEEAVEVFRDPTIYPQDTKVYFIQVESPTGTYIANGYVSRHEVPPLHLWPHTMGALFHLLGRLPIYQLVVTQFPYTLESAKLIDFITEEIADGVKGMMEAEIVDDGVLVNLDNSENLDVIPFTRVGGGVAEETIIRKVYNHPTSAAIGAATYSKVGPLVAPYLDGERAFFKEPRQVAHLQHKLIHVIEGKIPELVQLMLKWYTEQNNVN